MIFAAAVRIASLFPRRRGMQTRCWNSHLMHGADEKSSGHKGLTRVVVEMDSSYGLAETQEQWPFFWAHMQRGVK